MFENHTIAVVIPSYKVSKYLKDVVQSIPDFVDFIIVVDDRCPEKSYTVVDESEKIFIVRHESNLGVGGAVVSGYKKAINLNADYVVKIDGDGQMDANYMSELIEPLVIEEADYTKGNRFLNFSALRKMPKVRLFGNSALSFMVKASSGYWNIMDPTNGYTAISRKALNRLNLGGLAKRYFFESDMLINLNIQGCVVKDISIPARYSDESSSLSVVKTLFEFPYKLLKGLIKRIFYKYFLYDFNMASVYMLFGIPMLMFGSVFGSYRWYMAVEYGVNNPTGTIMLSVLSIILGIQFLLQAISIDIVNIPKNK